MNSLSTIFEPTALIAEVESAGAGARSFRRDDGGGQSQRWVRVLDSQGRASRAAEHRGVDLAVRFIRANYRRAISVSHLADVANLSRRGLHKAFVLHAGCSPGVALRHMRIKRACELLATSKLFVADIALRVGFRSANTFCIAFKTTTGMSPKQFRVRSTADLNGKSRSLLRGARVPWSRTA